MMRKFVDGRKAGTGQQPTHIAQLGLTERRENVLVAVKLGQADKQHILQS